MGCLPLMAQTGLTDINEVAAEAAEMINNAPREEAPKESLFKNWAAAVTTRLDFGHTSLTNWAAGGYNTVTLNSYIDSYANYNKNGMFWNNRLQMYYGFFYSEDKPFLQKSNDNLYLESKWGLQTAKKLYCSADFSMKSQFSNTYEYPGSLPADKDSKDPAAWKEARVLKSGGFSPANMSLALGLDYRPTNWLTLNMAPLTGGFVIVDNPLLRKAYSMPLKDEFLNVQLTDEETNAGHCYKGARFEFGAQLKMDIRVNINNNFSYNTQLLLFSNYLKEPQNIRVNWDNRIDWKLAKYFSLGISTNLIYDDNVMIKNEKDIEEYPDGRQRVQFKEFVSFGFTYTFSK